MDQEDFKDFVLLRQGAEAKIYTGTFLGQKSIVKERFSKKYRHPQLDERLTKERLKGEIRSLMRCKLANIRTPTIYFVDMNNGLFVMEYLDSATTCREYIDSLLKNSTANFDETRSKLTNLSMKIGQILGQMHKNNVIHGDLTTSNMMVQKETDNGGYKICLIDFGLGFAEGSPEDKGVDLYVLERALISTHPNTEFMFDAVINSYKKEMKAERKTECDEIIRKFEDIRMRGRKRTMVG